MHAVAPRLLRVLMVVAVRLGLVSCPLCFCILICQRQVLITLMADSTRLWPFDRRIFCLAVMTFVMMVIIGRMLAAAYVTPAMNIVALGQTVLHTPVLRLANLHSNSF